MKKKLIIASVLVALILIGSIIVFYPKEDIREIKITAKRFEYSPSEIILKKGEKVRLVIENVDFLHGLHFEDLPGEPGGDYEYIFEATEIGEFDFHCNRACGMGHSEMKGKVIVVEN